MKRKLRTFTFLRGLETTGREDGLELPAWPHFQNPRMEQGDAEPRGGMQLVEKFSLSSQCIDLNGTDNELVVPLDTRVHDLGMYWTIEMLFKPDDVTGTQALLAHDHATDSPVQIYLAGDTLTVKLTYTGGATTTDTCAATIAAGTAYALQVTRDGDNLYLALNGTAEAAHALTASTASVTPQGSLLIGSDGADNFFHGKIDYVRLLDVVWRDGVGAGWANLWRWLPDPRARYVLFDYVFDTDATPVYDRSRFENHGNFQNAVVNVDSLAIQTAPVASIFERIDWDGKHRLDVIAGKKIYLGEVGG